VTTPPEPNDVEELMLAHELEQMDEFVEFELEGIDADEAGDLSAPGGFDFGALLAQAQDMQQRLLAAQATVADQVVEGQAGGGVVRVRVSGGLEFQSVQIDPDAVDPGDVEMLQDLVLAAIRDAQAKVGALNAEAMGGFGDALGGLLP